MSALALPVAAAPRRSPARRQRFGHRPPKGLKPRLVAPGSTSTPAPPAKAPGRLRRGLIRGFAGLMVLMSLGLTIISSQESPAHAVDFECYVAPQFSGREPEQPGTGPESLFAAGPSDADELKQYTKDYGINWNDPDTYTLFEKDGVRGTTWSTTYWYQEHAFQHRFDGEDEKRCEFISSMQSMMAQTIFDLDRTITAATIALRQKATDQTPFLNMIRDMRPSIDNLTDHLFWPGLATMVMLSGAWVITKLGKQREIVQGLVGVGGTAIIVGFLLSTSHVGGHSGDPNYLWLAEESNSATSGLVNGFGNLLLPKTETDGPCYLGSGSNIHQRGIRELDCSIYQNLVFDPWAKGQFGGIGAHPVPFINKYLVNPPSKDDPIFKDGADMRILQVDAQSVSYPEAYDPKEYPWKIGGSTSVSMDPATKHGQWNVIRNSLFESYNDSFTDWKGENGSARTAAAFTGLISSVLVGIFVSATSLLTMIWNAVPVVLWLALPLVGLLAVFPPLQKLLRGWGETMIKAMTLGMVFGIAQMMAMMVVSGILQSSAALGWKCLLMLVMVLALWRVVSAARDGVFTPNLGGETRIFDADAVGRDGIRHARTAKAAAARVGRRLQRPSTSRATSRRSTSVDRRRRESARDRSHEKATKVQESRLDAAKREFREQHGRQPTQQELTQMRRVSNSPTTAAGEKFKAAASRASLASRSRRRSPDHDPYGKDPDLLRRTHDADGRERPTRVVKRVDVGTPTRKPRRGRPRHDS